ncbi:MAG: YbbR-like domain-containing protein [Flavobacteriales bacterium]|nr:YbbR-like domain-containing protein [Flavobacteriales bacterium]
MSKKTVVEFVDFLKPRLNRRSVAFLLCILLSALFWLLTSLSKEYVDEVIIPVEYENLPENLLIVNEPIAAVTAEVQGFGFDLLWHSLRLDKVQITVPANPSSLPSVKRGGEEIHFLLTQERTGKMSIGDDQLVVLKIYPDTLFIKFKPLFIKTVPVKLDADLSFAKQFGLISSPVVDPDTITVSGLQSEVEQIEFVATEHQSWTDLRESLTVEVPLNQIRNSRLVRYSHDQVQVAVNVTEFTEGSVSIPVNINAHNPESVKVYPSEVEVKYQVPLADYDKITPEMFRASVQVEENRNDQLLVVQLDETPVQVRQTRVNPPHVEYILQR